MELKGLSSKTSIVKLKEKLGYQNYRLRDKRDDILKIVRAVRAVPGGQLKADKAMAKMRSLDKEMTAAEARRVESVFKQLGAAPKEASLLKAVAAAEAKKAAPAGASKTAELTARAARAAGLAGPARVNRDPGSYTNIDTYRLEKHGTGLAAGSISADSHYGVAANRGETYDKGLGSPTDKRPAGRQRVNL